jgi:hypothetical protein
MRISLTMEETVELKDLLQLLQTQDQELPVFVAEVHRYKLAPTVSEEELVHFEK